MVDLGQKKVDSFRLFLCPVGKFHQATITHNILILSYLTSFQVFRPKVL